MTAIDTLVLINPKPESLVAPLVPEALILKFQSYGLNPIIYIPDYGSGITVFIRQVSCRPKCVLIAGDDSTTGSVLKGMMNLSARFGTILAGKLNNLASTTGLTATMMSQLR